MDLNIEPKASPNMEVSKPNQADCYFYYYSSCNKGSSCPFRHEPAALMNETMCLYWLKGNCSKPNCIYRHMELTKKRSTMACFFESQPGGCKKLHCPFLHNNVLDRPTEDDVPNNPDLILPVKDSLSEYENEASENKKIKESVAAQLKLHRKMSLGHLHDSEAESAATPPRIIRQPFIVPLQDGESDCESTTGNVKSSPEKPQPERDWELEKLREIQKQEGDILGYSLLSEDQEEIGQEDEMNTFKRDISFESDEEFEVSLGRDCHVIEEDSNESKEPQTTLLRVDLGRMTQKANEDAVPKRFVKRVLAENLQPRRDNTSATESDSTNKPSIKQRLGLKNAAPSKPLHKTSERDSKGLPSRKSMKERLSSEVSKSNESRLKRSDASNVALRSLRLLRQSGSNNERQITNRLGENGEQKQDRAWKPCVDGSLEPMQSADWNEGSIKIKTLAEIKAEREGKDVQARFDPLHKRLMADDVNGSKQGRNNQRKGLQLKRKSDTDSSNSKKQKPSPIVFGNGESHVEKRVKVVSKLREEKVLKPFESRKLTLKKSTNKTSSSAVTPKVINLENNHSNDFKSNTESAGSNTTTSYRCLNQSGFLASKNAENHKILRRSMSSLSSSVLDEELLLADDTEAFFDEEEEIDEDQLLL